MLRRKRMPEHLVPAWEIFQQQAERVEGARRGLLSCLPVGRVEPAPVAVGLDLIADELAAVAPELEAWRVPEIAPHWEACRAAVDEALATVPKARAVTAGTEEGEKILHAVIEVSDSLDPWYDAERAWLALRTR
jgi:hypothetical protein